MVRVILALHLVWGLTLNARPTQFTWIAISILKVQSTQFPLTGQSKDPEPLVFGYELCPNFSDDELQTRFGTQMVTIERAKRETRAQDNYQWTLRKFLKRYMQTEKFYLISALPSGWADLCSSFGLKADGIDREYILWMSSGNTSSVLHYDSYENFNCVLEGVKHFRLAAPEWFDAAYLTDGPGYGLYSDVDMEMPDFDRFPRFANIPFVNHTLHAGECIYIPMHWLHQVTSEADFQTGRNIAINLWFNIPSDKQSKNSDHSSGFCSAHR